MKPVLYIILVSIVLVSLLVSRPCSYQNEQYPENVLITRIRLNQPNLVTGPGAPILVEWFWTSLHSHPLDNLEL